MSGSRRSCASHANCNGALAGSKGFRFRIAGAGTNPGPKIVILQPRRVANRCCCSAADRPTPWMLRSPLNATAVGHHESRQTRRRKARPPALGHNEPRRRAPNTRAGAKARHNSRLGTHLPFAICEARPVVRPLRHRDHRPGVARSHECREGATSIYPRGRRHANSGSRCRLAAPVRRAMRGKCDSAAARRLSSGTSAPTFSRSAQSWSQRAVAEIPVREEEQVPPAMVIGLLCACSSSQLVGSLVAAFVAEQKSAGRSGNLCDSSVREARRREPAVVCQKPPVVRSGQFGDGRRSRPRTRRGYRNRGKGIARPEQPREPKRSWRAQSPHAWMSALRQRARFAGRPIPSKHNHVLHGHRPYRETAATSITRSSLWQA